MNFEKKETLKQIDEIELLFLIIREYDDWFTPAAACKMLCPQFMNINEEQLTKILLRATHCCFFESYFLTNGQSNIGHEFKKSSALFKA